jgi:hypothetical protein
MLRRRGGHFVWLRYGVHSTVELPVRSDLILNKPWLESSQPDNFKIRSIVVDCSCGYIR